MRDGVIESVEAYVQLTDLADAQVDAAFSLTYGVAFEYADQGASRATSGRASPARLPNPCPWQ